MHPQTLTPIPIPIPATSGDHDSDLNSDSDLLNSISTIEDYPNHDHIENPQIPDDFQNAGEISGEISGAGDNNPPDSFWVSNSKVTDWLDHHTFIERKASVKLVAVSRSFDPTQTRSSQRSVSFTHKPIIGFRQKPGPVHHEPVVDKGRLFKNRSVPGRGSVLQVNEPRSPRVSCIGRVGSMRGRARRTGFWRSVKTALLNRVRKGKNRSR